MLLPAPSSVKVLIRLIAPALAAALVLALMLLAPSKVRWGVFIIILAKSLSFAQAMVELVSEEIWLPLRK